MMPAPLTQPPLTLARSRACSNRRSSRPACTAAGVILGAMLLNLAYLGLNCPLDLAPDEAHYWHWSRRLDWSYYSKGPLVAWLIRASCELFGPLSVQWIGSEMLAVRLPAVLAQALALAGLYRLATEAMHSSRAGLATVAAALTLPPISAAGVLMTIDPPLLACWSGALVGVMQAVKRPDRLGGWLFAGVCSALGVLAKYNMLLFPPAVFGFLVAHRRAELRKPGFWLFLTLAAWGGLPILIWNVTQDWVSLRHVVGQASGQGSGLRPFGPLQFAAEQCAFLLGFWFIAFIAAAWHYRRTKDSTLSLLWWTSVPVWGVFGFASLFTEGQVNWPAAAYVGGFVLALAWVRAQLAGPNRRFVTMSLTSTLMLGVVLSLITHYPRLVTPMLARFAGAPTEAKPLPVRSFDPTCRLRGWRTLAKAVDAQRARVKAETGQEPVLAGMVWITPGELSFYCQGHPEAFSLGLALADRHSQYDLWRPNPLEDAQVFRGRSFLYVGEQIPNMARVFTTIEPPLTVVHREDGIPLASWTIWVGHGYRGFKQTRIGSDEPRY